MDKLDVAILRELTQAQKILPARPGLRPSYRKIAAKLNMSPGTVRNRVNRMYASGVIMGSSLHPNPNLLRLKAGACTVNASPLFRKDDVIRKLRLVEGVVFIHDLVGRLAWISFVYQSEQVLQRKLDLFKEISGAEGIFFKIPFPPCPESLTLFDARLVLHLTRHGFESYDELAKEMRVSGRTLQRRLKRLSEEGMLFSIPKVNYRAMTLCVPADLVVMFDDAETRAAADREIIQAVGEFTIFAAFWGVAAFCSMIVPSVSMVATLKEKVNLFANTRIASVEIVAEHIDQVSVMGEFLERWMAAKGWKPAVLPTGIRS